MEPLTTSTMIGGIVAYLGGKLSKDKSINSFLSDLTEATVNWIKPIFIKDDCEEKEIIQNLKEKPESDARKKAVESAIEIGIEDNPEAISYINEIFEKISKTAEGGEIVNNIINSKNVNTGNVNTGGGDFRIGDTK
jgi:hypothetical protein